MSLEAIQSLGMGADALRAAGFQVSNDELANATASYVRSQQPEASTPTVTNPFAGLKGGFGVGGKTVSGISTAAPFVGATGMGFGQAAYAGRSPINEVAREVFSGGAVATSLRNQSQLEREFEGYTQREQTQFNVNRFGIIANASKEAGAIYDQAQAEAIAQGGTLDVSRSQFISDYRSQVEKELAAQAPSGETVTLTDANGRLLFRGNKQQYVDWKLSQEPSTGELGKSYGMSMIPVYGTIQYGREAAKGGWTAKEVGLMAASIGADVATIVPPIGAVARASLKPALAGVMGASRGAIIARNLKTVATIFKKPVFARPTLKGLTGAIKPMAKEYWQSLKYPFAHPLETAKAVGGLASGKRIFYPVPMGYKGTANQYVTEQLQAQLKRPGNIQPATSATRYGQKIELGTVQYEKVTPFSGQTEGPQPAGIVRETVYPRTQGMQVARVASETKPLTPVGISFGEAAPENLPFASVTSPAKKIVTWQKGIPSGQIMEKITLSPQQQALAMSRRGYRPMGFRDILSPGGSPGMNLTPENLAYMRRTHLIVNPMESHPTWMRIEPVSDWTPFSRGVLTRTRPITGGGISVAQPSAATMTLEQLFRTTGNPSLTWAVSGVSPIAAVAKGSLPMSPGLPAITPITPPSITPVISPVSPPSPLRHPRPYDYITPSPDLTPKSGPGPEPSPSPAPSPAPGPKPVPPKPVIPTPVPIVPTPIVPVPPRPKPPTPVPPILPLPPLPGLGGGATVATTSYQPTNLGYWEFGEAFAGPHPITGKVRKIKFRKKIRYGNVPTKVLRSRISGQVNSDSPYYKREYIA